jgi:hypothetical protein
MVSVYSAEGNSWTPAFEDDGDVGTVVTRDRDWSQQGVEKVVPKYDKCSSYRGKYI